MKNASQHARRLKALLRQLRKQVTVPEPDELEPVRQMVHAFLVWESSRNQADQAYTRLMREAVDLNELRVSDPEELVELIGRRYARAEERAYRLTRALHAVYRREHKVDLSILHEMAKRDARAYLDGLEGMVPFVSASVCLLSLGAHAVPVDEQTRRRLANDGVADEDATLEEVQGFLERHVRAEDAPEAYYALRAYVERPIKVNLVRKKKSTPKAVAKKRSKKTTKKKSTKKKTGSK